MNRIFAILSLACAGALSFADGPGWSSSLDSAKSLAVESHKPVLVYLYAKWSRHCTRLEKSTLDDPKVLSRFREFVPVKVDIESETGKKLVSQFHVSAVPTLVVLDGDGAAFQKVDGFVDAIHLREKLTLMDDMRNVMHGAAQRLAANPNDADAAEDMARIYAKSWRMDACEPLLERASKLDPKNSKGKLARAFNAAGDYYQLHRKYDKAIALFTRGASVGLQKDDLIYSYISVGSCYLQSNRNRMAVPWFKKILALKDATANEKRQASGLLRQAAQGKAQFHAAA